MPNVLPPYRSQRVIRDRVAGTDRCQIDASDTRGEPAPPTQFRLQRHVQWAFNGGPNVVSSHWREVQVVCPPP